MPVKPMLGKKFGRLKVVAFSGTQGPRKRAHWECVCACGSSVVVAGPRLRNGGVRSCGCLVKERMRAQGTHNQCRRGAVSPTWRSWKAMLDRCKKEHKSKKYYFDKNITVCKKWYSFDAFFIDMGERPQGTTLDRKKNDQGYCKRNCRWSDASTQATNKSCVKQYTAFGETKGLTAWSKDPRCAVGFVALHKRVTAYNVPFVRALTLQKGSKLS